MATYEQLIDAARRADTAGDGAGAKRFLELAREAKTPAAAPVAAEPAPPPSLAGRNPLEAALIGGRQGLTFGFGDEIGAGAGALGDMLLRGKSFGEAYDNRLGYERKILEDNRAEHPIAAFGGEMGGAVLPALLTGGASSPMSAGRAAAYGGATGAAYGFGEGEGGLENRAASGALTGAVGAAGGAATAGIVNAIAGRKAASAAAKAVPGVDDLKGQASALYRAAEASGAKAGASDTQAIASTLSQIANDANIVMPDGSIAPKYTDVADALRVVGQYAGQDMAPGQMQVVRESLQEAAKANGREGKIGTAMLREFDTFTSAIAPELRQGDAIYSKAMKGSRIEQAVELAGSRAGQFSGSGFENALRTEFRALERKIIKGEIKGLTQPEKDAISKVARGGAIENVMRWIGKAAPTNIVSAGLGGGMPALVGHAFGGPAVGAAAGIGTMAAGTGARKAATALQSHNAEIAAALARSGGQLPMQNPAVEQIIQALIAAQRPAIAQAMPQ
jgi:hypothetical protein